MQNKLVILTEDLFMIFLLILLMKIYWKMLKTFMSFYQHRHKELKYEEYTLVAEYIPTYIPYSLVNDMLFTGRIVLTLNKNREFKYGEKILFIMILPYSYLMY